MARKVKSIGSGSAVIDGEIQNLKQYKTIKKYDFGLNEDPEGIDKYGIAFTPMQPTQDDTDRGVDGTFLLCYTDGEQGDRDADYDVLIQSMS